MKIVRVLAGIALGIPLLFVVVLYGASEIGGEVVTLDRNDASGDVSGVRIWIVDADGKSWIEHGDSTASWFTRLSESPKLVLTRSGERGEYLATPDPESHDLYHQLRRQKYGLADQLIEWLTGNAGDCPGIPVRLELAGSSAASPR